MSETIPPSWPPAGDMPDREPDQQAPAEGAVGDRVGSFFEQLWQSKLVRLAVLVAALGYLAYVSIWAFVLVMALAGCIFMHELGHYLVAKRSGMKVTEFFLGFGPRIWSFQRGETEYGVKLIWAGAYVKIIGMSNLDEIAPEDEARTYRAQSFGKRMPVVLAGPVMNLLLGFLLLLVVVVGFGSQSDSNWNIKAVSDGSAAATAGLQAGDRVTAFDGQSMDTWGDFVSLAQAHAGTTVDLTVERGGQTIELPVTIGWQLTDASAQQLGLQEGDRVTAVDGRPVTLYSDLVGALATTDGPVVIDYSRIEADGTVEGTTEVTGPLTIVPDGSKGQVGITRELVAEKASIVGAVPAAASQFGDIVVGSVQGMGRLFSPTGLGNLFHQVTTATDDSASSTAGSASSSGSSSSSSSSGSGVSSSSADADRPMSIIGIVNVGGQIGEQVGWVGVLGILALVNIFLGLINLVPLLPLDGGHIVVACYEEIRSRISHTVYRVNMAKLLPVTYVVLLLIVGLGLSTMYLDIVKPINLN